MPTPPPPEDSETSSDVPSEPTPAAAQSPTPPSPPEESQSSESQSQSQQNQKLRSFEELAGRLKGLEETREGGETMGYDKNRLLMIKQLVELAEYKSPGMVTASFNSALQEVCCAPGNRGPKPGEGGGQVSLELDPRRA